MGGKGNGEELGGEEGVHHVHHVHHVHQVHQVFYPLKNQFKVEHHHLGRQEGKED